VTEETKMASRYSLSSGFVVEVGTLGPHALWPIEQKYKDPGPWTYQVETKIEGIVEFIYDPPNESPDKEKDPEGWELYQCWRSHEAKRQAIREQYVQARTLFMLLNCVTVIDGPCTVDDTEWYKRIEHMVSEPKTHSERRLLFFLTQVFAISSNEFQLITQRAVAPEVTIEGVLEALEGFRSSMGGDGSSGNVEVESEGRERGS